jgi:hypothetical protein
VHRETLRLSSETSSPSNATARELLRKLRARILARLLALTAGVYLNHWPGRPTRALTDFYG